MLVLATERTDVPSILDEALAELARSRHELTVKRVAVTIGRGKFDFDAVGHYARPDVFQLQVNEAPTAAVVRRG